MYHLIPKLKPIPSQKLHYIKSYNMLFCSWFVGSEMILWELGGVFCEIDLRLRWHLDFGINLRLHCHLSFGIGLGLSCCLDFRIIWDYVVVSNAILDALENFDKRWWSKIRVWRKQVNHQVRIIPHDVGQEWR